ncbi:hypothetical protein GCM10027419_25570 [Pandoraea terrae]
MLTLLCVTQAAFAAGQCDGIYGLAKSAQQGFDDMTGPLLAQNEQGASYQATYSMPSGDCKIFRGNGLAPTYECVWDFQSSTPEAMRDRAKQFARDVARCTRGVTTVRTTTTTTTGLPADWLMTSKKYGRPVNFTISAQDTVTRRGERIREISLSVEKQ